MEEWIMDIKIGDLVLIEEGVYKGEKAIVKKVLDDSMLRLYVCSNNDGDVFVKSEYVTKVKKKQYSVQEIFDLAEEGDIFIDEYGYKYIYINDTILDYESEDYITEYYTLGTIMKKKFFKVVEYSKVKINKRDLNDVIKLLKDNGYNYEIEEV